ncbi:hypothetical protein GCM10009810_26970 [Nostocoides vanveenii]|uniref:Uncharacterized protein n=1 Tax=Nostocoides vanveenii TaxID=330835 RepID=A0ABN2KUS0_9MICO
MAGSLSENHGPYAGVSVPMVSLPSVWVATVPFMHAAGIAEADDVVADDDVALEVAALVVAEVDAEPAGP